MANSAGFLSSHSHRTRQRQPERFKDSRCFESRWRLPLNFAFQNELLDFGRLDLRHFGCWCQKHPWMNITLRRDGKTRSGFPGRFERCNRYRYPSRCSNRRTIISGPVSLLRTARMLSLRLIPTHLFYSAEFLSEPFEHSALVGSICASDLRQ